MTHTFSDSGDTARLLDAAAGGSSSAIATLFERHLPTVKESIQRRIRPQVQARFDASDVVQETHRDAHRRLADFLSRRPMPFRLWLLKTAHERLLDLERFHLRATKRSVDCEIQLSDASSISLASFILESHINPASQAMARERALVVRTCLAKLNSKDRDVLLLRVFDGLSNAEVAAVLELSREATKKRFLRALLKLKGLLVEAGLSEPLT